MSAVDQLLVVIDPVARRVDGESVRIAIPGPGRVKIALHNSGTRYRFTWSAASRAGHSKVVRYVVTLNLDGKERGVHTMRASTRSTTFSVPAGAHSVSVTVKAVNAAGGASVSSDDWFAWGGGF